MAGKLSFAIAINLLTENFKRGTNNVKAGFRAMQMQVLTFAAALGAGGLGLSNFVTRLIDVARETSRVTTALKNVSGTMTQYADNQRYLVDLAKKYGLEINALTGNYAKFTAAASISGMTMADQRKIFESTSRACTAFGMSADDSNGVFLALSQMMSKGKISSEELRLQMGERLPIALQAMAKAAGVSVGGLDKLMKQGKLMSADILPKFADALNEMIPNVDTDNLETSMNRLKNAFTEFAKGTDIQSKYKALIDWLTGAVQTAGENIKGIVNSVVAFIIGASLGRLFKWIVIELAKSQRAALIAASKASKAANVAFDEVAWKAKSTGATISMAFSRMGKAIKAAFMSALPAAVLIIVSELIARFVTIRQEAKRIGRIFSDYKAEAEKAGNTQDVIMLKEQLNIMNDKKQSQENINNAQSQLQKMLGVERKSQEELNKLVAERVKLLEETARAQFHANKIPEIEDKNRELTKKFKEDHGGNSRYSINDMLKTISDYGYQNKSGLPLGFRTKYGLRGTETGIRSVLDEYSENLKSIGFSKAELTKSTVSTNKLTDTRPLDDLKDNPKDSPLQKAEKKYAESLRELDARREIEKTTDSDYYKAVDDLGRKMLIEAKASGDKEILNSEYIKMLEDVIDHPLYNETQAELEKVQKEYSEKIKEYQTQQSKGLISQKELDENIASLSIESAKSAASIKGIGNTADGFITEMMDTANARIPSVKKKDRDTTFDYKKSNVDIAGETLDNAKEYAKELQEQAKKTGKELSDELAKAMANVPSLEQALKLAEVQEDIKQLGKELDESLYSGIKNTVGIADSLVSSFKSLEEAFDPESEADGWERLMAIWNAMTTVVDSFLSIADMMEDITELTNKLVGAKVAEEEVTKGVATAKGVEATVDTSTTLEKVANDSIETASAVTATGTKAAASVAASGVEAAAYHAAMVAGATAAFAAIPVVGPVLAAGQIAAMEALMLASAIPFAKGGIITGGPSSGDKILARVNAGEMILNGGQQANLFDAINSGHLGSSGSSSTITTKIRSKDLILIINNELKSQGKKPIS